MHAAIERFPFDEHIARLIKGFTGREWVFAQVDAWLRCSDIRFFLLTGEPGVGKSAVAARLVTMRKDIVAYHFCIAFEAGTIQPDRVLLSIAAQLIEHIPGYVETLANVLDPLRLSVNVKITVESLKDGAIRAVVIEHLHTRNPKEALDIVLRRTLEALATPPQRPVLILIDSLDEAATYDIRENLVTLLATVNDLPPWLRFILTSRPDEGRVLNTLSALRIHRCHLDGTSREAMDDISEYIENRALNSMLADKLRESAIAPDRFTKDITQISEGNFLYTKVLLDNFESGLQPLDPNYVATLPKSLGEIYNSFLLRIQPDWDGRCHVVLETLCICKAPLTREEIIGIGGREMSEAVANQVLSKVSQFLNVVADARGQMGYQLYHHTLRDYLVDRERNPHFWCSPLDGHRRIIEHYWQYYPGEWEYCDAYGVRFLSSHLLDAVGLSATPTKGRTFSRMLDQLLSAEHKGRNTWFEAKERVGDARGFSADVSLAWNFVDRDHDANPHDSTRLQCKYALMHSSLVSIAGGIPGELITRLVEAGAWSQDQALAQVYRLGDAEERAATLAMLANSLPGLLPDALEATRRLADPSKRVEILAGIALRYPELLQETLDALQELPDVFAAQYTKASVLSRLAPQFRRLVPTAIATAEEISFPSFRAIYLTRLLPCEPGLLLSVLTSAWQTIFGYEKSHVLREVRAELPRVLPMAIETATRTDTLDELLLALLFSGLAAEIPAAYHREALDALVALANDQLFSRGLAELAPHLDEVLSQAAVTAARELHGSLLAATLGSLSRRVPVIRDDAVKAMRDTHDEPERTVTLVRIASAVPEFVAEAVQSVLAIEDAYLRASLMSELASSFPHLWKDALDAIGRIHEMADCSNAVLNLISKLPESHLAVSLRASASMIFGRGWTSLLNSLPDSVLDTALEVVLQIRNEFQKQGALNTLIPRLPVHLVPRALDLLRRINDERERVETLIAFAVVNEKIVPKVEKAITAIADERTKADCLIKAGILLGNEHLITWFGLMESLKDESAQVYVIAGLGA